MRTIEVGPRDVSEVRTGTFWRIPAEDSRDGKPQQLLVLTPLTERVYNVCWWPEEADPLGPETTVSMMADDVIVASGELVACATEDLLALIHEVMRP